LPIETLHELTDEEVITALTQVKGIGRWTAQMFMMFRLGRPDVLPDLDLGVQKAIQKAYRLRKLPTPERVLKIGAKWAPYRTVASWYLWRSLDTPDPVPRSSGSGRGRKTG
jgi:DNA-3-methyladenine glycosylase II